MGNFDTLKGLNNFSDMDLNELLSFSYNMYLDWGFLDKGAFTNVKLNDNNIYGANRSILRLASDPQYLNGQVWETFHNKLVWESGISSSTQPIPISGVYVNNTFYPLSTSGAYKYHIEYENGRVVFNTPILATSTVNMEYSYKLISITEARDFPILKQLQFRTLDPFNNNFLQTSSGEYNKNSNNKIQLPLIGIDVAAKVEQTPYELGNYVQKIDTDIIFHILGETDAIVKKIVSILTNQKETTTYILDMNAIAKSGMFPINYDGTLALNPKTYPNLVAIDAFKYGKAFVSKSYGQMGNWINNNLYHGSVRFTVETIY